MLRKGGASGAILDVIGQVGFDPGTQWGTDLASTADNTIRRKTSICAGDITSSDAFDPTTEWDGFAQDVFSGLGAHTSSCSTLGASITLTPTTLNFTTTVGTPSSTESYVLSGSSLTSNVDITAPATFGISSSAGGPFSGSLIIDATTANAGTTLYVQYNPTLAGNHSGNLTHVSGSTSANLAVQGSSASTSITPIYTIQGTTDISPLDGTVVTTEGVVVADFQGTGQLNGFYIQDATGDGNTSTSDGILVFNTTYPVNVGDLVRLTGEVDEFFNMTEIKTLSALTVLSTGNALPAAVNITLPVAAIADLEKSEGMLVSFPQTLTATEVYALGRFGEVSLSANGRLFNPTNFIDPNDNPASGISSTGTSNLAAVTAQQDLNNRSRILLDDASSVQNPAVVPYLNPVDTTLRIGSTVANVTGVLEYAFSKYRIQPTVAPSFNYAARPTVPTVGAANVKVACFNVLNYFNGDGMGGGFPTARGAHTLVEFNRQRAKIIAAISQLNADVIGLMEIENDGSSSTSAIADLVNGLNAATSSGTYAYVVDPTPANGGTGTDAIKVAMIYKPGVVSPTSLSIADNNAVHNRPPLAQTFTLNTNSEKFTVVVNHFKSKSSSGASGSDLDQLDGQGAYNNARKLQASALLTFISGIQTTTGDQDIITVGDYNAYGQEDPIDIFLAGGLVNLLPNSYSYVFDGQTGSLDHALVSSSLTSAVTGADKWHLNSDEPIFKDYNQEFNPAYAYSAGPFRSSDHDPLLLGFNLQPAITSFKLQLLHSSDGEGGSANMANFAAVLEKLEGEYPNTIKISSGDNWIPGPFFNASGDRPALDATLRSVYNQHFGNTASSTFRASIGRADISILNLLKYDASAFGNHEFDAGSNVVGEIVGFELSGTDKRWTGSQFPYLSANLDFSGDASLASLFSNQILDSKKYLLNPDTLKSTTPRRKIAPATIVTVNGEQIGVVGATTQILESISSVGGVKVKGSKTNNMTELATYIQPVIDQLRAMGINKIIVASHLQQIALEKQLVGLLHGVDIVIAGGSSTLLADANDALRPSDVAVDTYPLVSQNADSEPALVVNVDQEWKYVGRLVVDFDLNGVLDLSSLDSTINGVYATTDEMVINLHGSAANAFAAGTKAARVRTLVDAVNAIIAAKDGNILGKTSVYLNGRRTDVRTQETNFGNLSNDANIAIAKQYDSTVLVGIKNGGGIRTSIGEVVADPSTGTYQEVPPLANPVAGKLEGDISQLDIENSLRFNNSLSLVSVTASQLLQLANHGVAATVPGATPGQFPQIGGLKFSFDATLAAGSRVKNLVVIDSTGKTLDVIAKNGVVQGDPARAIRVVTLTFLLTGGDGYPFPSFITANPSFANRVDLVTVGAPKTGLATFTDNGSEQDAFAEYIASRYATTPYNKLDEAMVQDDRIQNLAVKSDSVLGTAPVVSNFSKSTNEDVTLAFTASDFTNAFADVDGDALTNVTIVSLPTRGLLKLNNVEVTTGQTIAAAQLSTLRFVPNLNVFGSDTFSYKGSDLAFESNNAKVSIAIISVNDAPVVTNFSKTVTEDSTIVFTAFDFLNAYSDVEGKQLDKITIVSLPTLGKLKLNNVNIYAGQVIGRTKLSGITFVTDPNAFGTASFAWKASDLNSYSLNATVSITVLAVNDLPIVSNFTKNVNEDQTLVFSHFDFLNAYSDAEAKPLNKITVASLPTLGKLKLNNVDIVAGQRIGVTQLGAISFVPYSNVFGSTSFAWKASDFVNYSQNGVITINVNSVNDAPVVSLTGPPNGSTFAALSTIAFTATASDIDGTVKVQFYAGSTLVGEDLEEPFSFDWHAVEAGTYALTAKAVDNEGGVAVSNAISVTVGCTANGGITRYVYSDIYGSNISDLTSHPKYPNDWFKKTILNSFEIQINQGNYFGTRIIGYICPPQSGNYTFYVSSDDKAELWLSTDSSKANRVKIASVPNLTNFREYTKYPAQTSVPVYLVKGAVYFVETLHKENNQNDHLSVAWRMPDNTFQNPISGVYLSTYPESAQLRAEESFTESTETLASEMMVSPVPAVDFVNVDFTSNGGGTEISILDALSHEVLHTNISAVSGSNRVQLSVQNLAAGIYYVNVISEEKRSVHKIVVSGK